MIIKKNRAIPRGLRTFRTRQEYILCAMPLCGHGASWTTRPNGGGCAARVEQISQLKMLLASAALVPAFLDN